MQQGWDSVIHAGIATFMGTPKLDQVTEEEIRQRGIKAGVLVIPFDSITITRSDSMMGPRAVRDALKFTTAKSDLIRS